MAPLIARAGVIVFLLVLLVVVCITGRDRISSDGQASWKVVGGGPGCGRADRAAHRWRRTTGSSYRGSDRHRRWQLALRRIKTCLDKILAFRLGDQRLELGGGECVDKTCL